MHPLQSRESEWAALLHSTVNRDQTETPGAMLNILIHYLHGKWQIKAKIMPFSVYFFMDILCKYFIIIYK